MPVVPLMTTEQRVNGPAGPGSAFGTKVVIGGPLLPDGPPSPPPSADVVFVRKEQIPGEQAQTASTDLGAQVVEGVLANGTRTTLTIPAGQIGNDRPITIVTEVWTSPDLKTIVYSRRSDPRTGEQTFRLTNIQRTEPDAALFTVPPDFTFIDGPQRVIYGPK